MEDFDAILTILGTGKWNLMLYISLSYWYSCVCYQTLGAAFFTSKDDYTCRAPADAFTPTVILPEDFDQDVHNSTSYTTEEKQTGAGISSCTYLVQDNVTGKVTEERCNSWDFGNSTFTSTITSEFELVCDREFLRATYLSIYMLGNFFGALISGFLADRYGRRTVVMVGTISYSVICAGSSWLPSVTTLLIGRFLLGIMHPTSLQTAYILALEMTQPKHRTTVGMMQFVSWGFGAILLSGWAYLIRDWRWLQMLLSLFCIIFLPSLWLIDESPRWLIIKGRHEEAMKILEKAARWNNVVLPSKDKLLTVMENIQKTSNSMTADSDDSIKTRIKQWMQSVIILFRTPKLRIITLIMYLDFFVVAMVYYGLSLSGGYFKFNQFLFMAIGGLSDMGSNTVTIPVVKRFGRKIPLIASYAIAGASLLTQPIIPSDYVWIVIMTVMLGKFFIATVFNIVFLYATELFPTEVRTRGMGTSMMWSRVGAMVAPYLLSFISETNPWATSVVFGFSAIAAGLAALRLHETMNIMLPDTIAHLEGGHCNLAMEMAGAQ